MNISLKFNLYIQVELIIYFKFKRFFVCYFIEYLWKSLCSRMFVANMVLILNIEQHVSEKQFKGRFHGKWKGFMVSTLTK